VVNPAPERAPERVTAPGSPIVLLVDLHSLSVVQANAAAVHLAGKQPLPLHLDDWCARAGLVDGSGRALATTDGALRRLTTGETVESELVSRKGDDGTPPSWYISAFPLRDGAGRPGLDDAAVVVLLSPGVGAAHRPAAPNLDQASGTEAMYDRAVLATGVSFTISDPSVDDNPLVWVNPAFTRTTGYSQEQAVGRNCRFLQGGDTDPDAVARVAAALADRRPVTETLLNYRADGTSFWNEVSISPVLDGDGELVNFVGVQADVTLRVESDARREQALEAERKARGRLALLADVAEAVTELDTTGMLRRLARVLARDLLAWCAVLTADDDLRLVAVAGLDDPGGGRPFLLPRRGQAGGTATDQVVRQLAGDLRTAVVLDPDSRHDEASVTRWILNQVCAATSGVCRSIPIPGRRDVLGLLIFSAGDDDLDPDDEALLTESARRVGLSLENARLYAREHLLAETLQQSMLPEQISVPDLDLWSYYAPNVDHAQVGGDWYDVMQPEGAVGIVIGDVVGHDIEAAAAMGQLRSVVRAYAYEQDEPGTVLMRVDQLVRGMRISRTASMVYARLEADDDGGWEMSWCRAGHLPPILLQNGAVTPLMQGGGTLVGIGDRPRVTSSVQLGPGDVVLFYTDGLIERRARRLMDGLERLQQVAGELVLTDSAGIGEQLLSSLGKAPEDDMAIVVLRVPSDEQHPPTAEGPRQRRWQLTGDPTSIGRARRLTVQTCRLWRLTVGGEAELVVSELVANAVLHGWGTVGLRLSHSERGLLIEVEDGNPHPPEPAPPDREGPGGYGLHVVQRLAEWGWRRSGPGKTVWARIPVEAPSDG
jgi:PAS domain S-box-containing protein